MQISRAIFGFFVLFLLFVPLERFFSLRKDQKVFRKGFFNDIIHFLINNIFSQLGLFILLGILILFLDQFLVSEAFQAKVASQPGWLQFLEAILLAGVGQYWAHRLVHTIPWLWKFHAIHHSIEEMDWLASARLHPLDQVFIRSFTVIPLYLMGFSAQTFGAYVFFATLWAIFLHSNVRFRFGFFRYLFGTPEFHHWHHSKDPEARDKNFSGNFPWLDMLFGSFYLPKGKWPEEYGVDGSVPTGYFGQMLYPFRRKKP